MEFLLGFIVGWFTFQIWVTYRAKKILAEIQARVEQSIKADKENTVELEFQKQGNKIYAYQVKDGVFVSHGTTMEELIEDLEKRFPNTTFVSTPSQIKGVVDESV